MDSTNHPRVIVAVERSLSGYAALRVAVGLARRRSVPLQAIRSAAGTGLSHQEYIDRAFAEALGGDPSDLDITKSVVFDSLAGALAQNASDPRDMIVVGNDARGALRALWSGSTARGLLKRARCQVLVVPVPEMDRATRRSARKLRRHRADVWDRFRREAAQPPGRPYQSS